MFIWDEYTNAVQTGKRKAGRLERLAVEHALRLRKEYHFDEKKAAAVINLVHQFKHTKGKWRGQKFNLLPHQAFFIAYLFGLKNNNGQRLIREAMFNMSKKGGKSELAGAIAVLFTFFDGEQTAECYTAANKTEQALFSWKSAKGIATQLADDFPEFDANFKYYDNRLDHVLIDTATDSFFKTLPYESKSLDGVNPHLAIIDEFHEYPDTSLPDNLQSGMVLREQPLLLYVTTRGFHPYGPLAQKEEYYTNVMKGLVKDDRVFPVIFSLDKFDNWENRSVWIKCAPGMPYGLPTEESLAAEQTAALEEGGEKLVSCKTKNFNIWQRAKADFVQTTAWEKGNSMIDMEVLKERLCFGAFDVGRTDDLSALGWLFPPENPEEKFIFIIKFFMPSDMVSKRSREHKVSYRQWIDAGYIVETPGNITDTSYIMEEIENDLKEYNVFKIGADKAFAIELLNRLSVRGAPVIDYPQRYSTMNGPILEVQKVINGEQFQHGDNPVLSWMCSNVTLKKNTGGQVMFDKSDRLSGKGKERSRTRRKIDGMVVLAMCMGLYLDWIKENETSIYEEREIRFL